MQFKYRSYSNEVLFGKEKLDDLADLLRKYRKITLIASNRFPDRIHDLIKKLGDERVSIISSIKQHVPKNVVDPAVRKTHKQKTEVLVAMGGGSAIGLAKAIALETDLPIVAIPTTYSGSEQTNIWGISTVKGKFTGKSDKVLPRLVWYDPELTRNMPYELAVKSAINAMAHLIEAIYAPDANPVTSHQAVNGLEKLTMGLKAIIKEKHVTEQANEQILFGAFLAGKCLCEVSMSLHHKTAHVLGGTFGLDHASVHSVILPYVLEYQWPWIRESDKQVLESILGNDPVEELSNLIKDAAIATDLNSIGFRKEYIIEATEEIMSSPYPNIAPLDRAALDIMLANACAGSPVFAGKS